MAPSIAADWSLNTTNTDFERILTLKKRGLSSQAPLVQTPFPDSYPSLPDEGGAPRVLDIDAGTPDGWIKRDERIIRLTGKHPLNAEAPLTTLFDTGFLTPASLFYVRTHGAVPKVDPKEVDDWTISIDGLVSKPAVFSIAELKKTFKVVTLPITLVCAGNRRKEQNVVRKGLGFNWGAGGVSTALFTGVYLADILEYVKPTPSADEKRKPKHVVFEGIDKLPQGPYGTSQKLSWAGDKNKGMLISWAMNGLPLTPDHGFPLRLVVPGQIGGRSVKWLNRIEVSHEESQHYLHFWDNKVLPTEVAPEQARAEKHWWYDSNYIINDLNINSAIAHPAHEEVILPGTETYTIKGYAYSGGGRRICRMEISLDEGDTWLLCKFEYPEDQYRKIAHQSETFGTIDLSDIDEAFSWCFWSYEVDTATLRQSASIQVRAMDQALTLQQRDMYWNPTSMMNNWWFRVAIHVESDGKLRFEHPTVPANAPGGWMQRMKDEGLDIRHPVFTKKAPTTALLPVKEEVGVSMIDPSVTRLVTLQELHAHDKPEEPWFVVNGQVYDGTGFLNEHPGGGDSITGMAGQDASEDFMSIHSTAAQAQLAKYHIGTLVNETSATKELVPSSTDTSFLSKSQWKKVVLASVENASHDSRYYRFALEKADQALGLPTGQHVYVRIRKANQITNGEAATEEVVQRAYTPVSKSNEQGFIELLIKLYLPNQTFPAGGKMSGLFNTLQVGDSIEIKGPTGSFTWLGKGMARWKTSERKVRNVGMICGGSGITPILQVLRGIFEDEEDTETNVWVIDANRTEKDILCRQDLEALLETAGDRYHLHYTLNMPPGTWKYSQGRINVNMLRRHLPPPSPDSLVLICGPGGMISGCKADLTEIGWDVPSQLVVF